MTVSSSVSWKRWVKLHLCWQTHAQRAESLCLKQQLRLLWTFAFSEYNLPPPPRPPVCFLLQMFAFLQCTETETVSHTPQLQAWYPEKREKAQCEEQTQKEDSWVIFIILNHWCRQKQGCTIVTNLYSYFHSLILNSLTWGIISTAFPVFLFYTTWSAASSLCKIWRSRFWPPRNNLLVMHAVSKATWGTEGEVGPATHSLLSSQLEHRPWLSAVSSSELQVPLLLTFYSSWISKRERQDLANCRIQSLRKINTQSTQNNNHLLYKNMLRVSGE